MVCKTAIDNYIFSIIIYFLFVFNIFSNTFFSVIFPFVHVNVSRFYFSVNEKRNCAIIYFMEHAFSQRMVKLAPRVCAMGCRVTINLQLARYLLYESHWPDVAAIISRRNYLPSAVNSTCTLRHGATACCKLHLQMRAHRILVRKLASV